MTRLDFLCPQIILKLLPCPKYINQFSLAQLSSISDFEAAKFSTCLFAANISTNGLLCGGCHLFDSLGP